MATKISTHSDQELLLWMIRLDEAVHTVLDAEKAFGVFTIEISERIRKIQQEIQEEIGHRAVIGTWVGYASPT